MNLFQEIQEWYQNLGQSGQIKLWTVFTATVIVVVAIAAITNPMLP